MPNPEISSFKQILLTFAFVVLGGVGVFASLGVDQLEKPEVITNQPRPVRSLASQSEKPTSSSKSSQKIFEVSAEFCVDQFEKTIQHSRNFIQMTGAWCGQPQMKIKHSQNQFEATVVQVSAGKFLTDVIPLTEGKNILTLEGQKANGKAFTSRLIIEHKL